MISNQLKKVLCFGSLGLLFISFQNFGNFKRDAGQQASKSSIRVMSFNVQYGADKTESKSVLRQQVALMQKENPDVIFLQEVAVNTRRSNQLHRKNSNILKYYANRLGYYRAFAKVRNFQGGEFGVGILSRWPIGSRRVFKLPVPRRGDEKERVVLGIKVYPWGKRGEPIVFATSHFGVNNPLSNARNTFRWLDHVDEFFSVKKNTKVIFGGDFNIISERGKRSQTFNRLFDSYGFQDSIDCSYQNNFYTKSVRGDKRRIDYILFKGIKSCDNHYFNGTRGYSDHNLVVTDFILD